MKKVSNDPHAGPVVGDASYRLHFPDPESFRAAMALAAQLEAKGLARRAWRVRWNLDGPQPARMPLPPTTMETDDDRGGRASTEVPGLARMVERTGLSNWQIGRAHHARKLRKTEGVLQMSKLQEAARRALAALNRFHGAVTDTDWKIDFRPEIDALRDALAEDRLAEPAEPITLFVREDDYEYSVWGELRQVGPNLYEVVEE